MALVFAYGAAHLLGWTAPLFTVKDTLAIDATLILGLVAGVAAFVLFVCTAMIYASLRFLQEWHHWLTVANYTLFGLASGFTLAAAFSALAGRAPGGFLRHLGGDLHRAGLDHPRRLALPQRAHQGQDHAADRHRRAPYSDDAAGHGLHGRLLQHPRILPRQGGRHSSGPSA